MSARISAVLFLFSRASSFPARRPWPRALNNHPIAAHHQAMLSRLARPFGQGRTVRQTAPQIIFLLPIPHSLVRMLPAVAEELSSTAGDGKLADTSLTATGSICMTNDLAAVGFPGIPAPRFERSLKSAKWTCNVGAPRRILLARRRFRRWPSQANSKKARRLLKISVQSAAPPAAARVSH